MNKLMVTLSLALTTSFAFANPTLTFETFEVTDPQTTKIVGTDVAGAGSGAETPAEDPKPKVDRLEQAGKIISTAKDVVALGESIYQLVQKGKPSNTTDYAPISVVPKDPETKLFVDPFELENCSFPVEKKFVTSIKSGAKEAVRFEYMVVYSHSCSFNGKGSYIQAASVIPTSVKSNYGWDFTAVMKLSGIMNHGTKENPVAGAMLVIKYTMNNWRMAMERNDSIYITGRGEIKAYNR